MYSIYNFLIQSNHSIFTSNHKQKQYNYSNSQYKLHVLVEYIVLVRVQYSVRVRELYILT